MSARSGRLRSRLCNGMAGATVALLAACGGSDTADESANSPPSAAATSDSASNRASVQSASGRRETADPFAGLSLVPTAEQSDAVRLAQQATFGPTSALITEIESMGAAGWISKQMTTTGSVYTHGADDAIHKNTRPEFFCSRPDQINNVYCWRDYYSAEPVSWDFYRNAIEQPDQLRQRVAHALQQIFVISSNTVYGTYGWRNYENMLLENAFGNYRELLRRVTLSPLMGEFLDMVNNDKSLPNENYARELLQLFSIGTCKLNADGTLATGKCKPTYNNETVREYAYALTGWTYPAGGQTAWGCWPSGANCAYFGGDMVPATAFRDAGKRRLLSDVFVPANSNSTQALSKVLDSLMQHPNTPPFVAKKLIQHLVKSNPSDKYVGRVASAFKTGTYQAAGRTFGQGKIGDMAATVAAVLLDSEARGDRWDQEKAGHLREPILHVTGAIRALNGHTDGAALYYWWSELLRQQVFRPPSVFSFYPSDYPVAGTSLVGPEFGIHNSNTALERLNFLTYLLDWNGSAPDPNVPDAVGTRVDLTAFLPDAKNAEKLVDGLSMMTLGRLLPEAPRAKVLKAVKWWSPTTDPNNWQAQRVKAAAYLVLGSPDYQVQR
ncbi:DUF1800 domain-containing protein [Ideonella sp. DXS29W]|uniref:DUF1800 domain-containing protein n=1 Tax=Ideonella lacteola TaxID=2984193 RepID=A0ABU9BV24_9BURK